MTQNKHLIPTILFFFIAFGFFSQTSAQNGWDILYLDEPSFLHFIEYNATEELVYVFGGTQLRVVNTGANFSVQNVEPQFEWNQEFIGIDLFRNASDVWAIGVANPSDYSVHPYGYTLPLVVSGPLTTSENVHLPGFIMYSVYIDSRNPQDILAYMVGWIPVVNSTVTQVGLGLARFHLNVSLPYSQRALTFNYNEDVVVLTYNSFTSYSKDLKPLIHYNSATNTIIIIDPSESVIFTCSVGPGSTPMQRGQSELVRFNGKTVTSSYYFASVNRLYVGYAARGTGNGTVVAFDVGTLTMQNEVTFNGGLSNPRAITVDEEKDIIYVGFNDGDYVVQLDFLLNIKGWQNVPGELSMFEAATVGDSSYIYFITNQQHSKIARVSSEDFCSVPCSANENEYCLMGKCVPMREN